MQPNEENRNLPTIERPFRYSLSAVQTAANTIARAGTNPVVQRLCIHFDGSLFLTL